MPLGHLDKTPFGLDEDPTIRWGEFPQNLTCLSKGSSIT